MQSELTETAPAEAENIAVCIRVRPMNERETRNRDVNVLATVPQMNVISLTDESGQPLGGKSNVFQYDQIFDASSDAHGIYDRVAKRIVRSTLGGINGTIFAYGQTSSGKTYTMQGDGVMPFEPEEATNKPGILQLAVEDIFKYIEKCSDRDFLLRVSFLEIYNEVVKDLLNPTEKGANLKLREDPRKGVYVECKEEIITNYENIVTLLQTGNQHRTVGQTAMNDRSSRSHSVFRIVIESKEKSDSRRLSEEDVNGAVLVASLNLVDLAGSESLRHTAAEGIRQREAGNINKSLLTLARVINSLASSGGGGQNAPFRDSKLTRLLQTSLGGNTRTLIICCVTPSDRYVEETKSTLQFAARAKDIQTSATVNEVLDDQTQLRRLKREVHDLKKLVNSEALNALKAENEALISEKNHNKTEMARLMGLILSSASVTKSTVGKKRKHHGKHKRETWGPGDFPANLKSLAPLSPNLYPRKRHFSSKENVDPQILLRVHEDIPENALHNSENPVFASVDSKFKPNQTNLGMTCLEEQKMLLREKISEDEVDDDEITPTAEALSVGTNKEELQGEPSVDQDQNGTVEKLAGELQNIMQELAQLQADNEKSAMEKEELQAVTDRINQELEVSQRQGYEMSEALMEKEHIAKVLQAQLNAKMTTISQMQTKRCSEIESLQQSIQDLAVEKESLVTRIQQLESVENTEVIDEEIEMSDSAGSVPEQQTEVEPQKLCSEVDQLSEKLLAAESELAQANERLEAVKDSSELSELRAAFDNLQADYDNLQKMNAGSLRERPVPEQQLEEPTSSEQQNAKLVDQTLQERYDALNADCERLAGDLEKLTHEREDCVDELRALENQLMEVSEDKMKLAVAVDEREMRLREMQQLVMSSTDEITALQVKLEETQSAKVALEDCKAGLEENVETAQAALQALQVDYNAVVEQLQCRTTALVSGSECTDSDVEQLQQRLEKETRQRERLELDVKSYEETLSVMRTDVKDGSHTIADLMDKLRTMQMSLDAAARSQELKDTEMVSLTDALTKAKEEEAELRFQRQQRMVAAEAKEMALEEKVSALQQQLTMSATGNSVIHDSTQTELQLIADKEKQEQLQHKVKTLDTQLAEAHQQLSVQDREWRKKQTMAETEFARMTTEQQQLREQVSILQSSIDANSVVSQQEATEQTAELLKVKRAYDELMEQKEVVQHELEIGNANWEEKEQDILRQMNSICEQFQEAQEELEEYKKSADAEIRRLHSLIEEANARIEEVKHATRTREEKLESQIGEQENWQNHVKNRQEELQAKCEELDDERRVLKEKYAALETERSDVEEQLQNEIHELSQECAFAKAQHADSEDKLKEMEAKLVMTENDVEQNRSELENLSDSLKSAQTETVQYHNKLVEAQVAKESMEKFIEKQKARIDKLEKVKMTTETLDLFRKLKNDRQDLQTKVQKLQQNLAEAGQALTQTQENHKQEEQRLVEHNEELQLFKQHIEELREALRVEKHQVVDIKAEMRNALHDEHEKAEHEIQEMQTLLKEKIDRAEQLEAAVASLEDNMTKLKQQKSENVSYLEKENLDLLVENRRLKKQLEPPSETGDELGITGTFDASAAEAAKALGGDSVSDVNEVELSVPESDGITTASTTAPPTRSNHAKAGGFLLSKTELDAIAGDSQEEQKDETRPECHQQ
ncbi:hypothetical protein BBI17_008283 [Phytophthora kernoviae]|uniref:Kinesin motor domain-containing protein n=1 Tax=Phytophthora kernoviae TaxID=325452 RepID=A0A3R7G5J8_9STRA|nr:hypothetical protein BBI17_008283 [Phytophthora kernoviae]